MAGREEAEGSHNGRRLAEATELGTRPGIRLFSCTVLPQWVGDGGRPGRRTGVVHCCPDTLFVIAIPAGEDDADGTIKSPRQNDQKQDARVMFMPV